MPKEARVLFNNQVDMSLVQFGKAGDFKDSQVCLECILNIV